MTSIQRILLSAVFLFSAASGAESQNSPPGSAPAQTAVHVITHIEVTAASIPRAIGLLRQYRDELAQSGNSSVDLYQELGRPYRFAINEQWQDRSTFEAQGTGAAMARLLAAVKELQTAPPDSHVFQGFAVGPVRPPGPGRAKLLATSYFEIPAPRLAEFDALARPYVEASRADEGGMRFDVLQELNPRENHVAVFEIWSSPQDFEAHRTSTHVRRFREGLAPMLSGAYDDRLYGKFD